MDNRHEAWFRPKRYGYDAGLPIHWKGWALMAATFAAILIAVMLATLSPVGQYRPALVLIVAAVTVPFAVWAKAKTEGGWHWRWGSD